MCINFAIKNLEEYLSCREGQVQQLMDDACIFFQNASGSGQRIARERDLCIAHFNSITIVNINSVNFSACAMALLSDSERCLEIAWYLMVLFNLGFF